MAPTVFWGHTVARGVETLRHTEGSFALILMGDWCGPCYGAVTSMTENRGAEQDVTLLWLEKKQASMKKVFREWCDLLTRAF